MSELKIVIQSLDVGNETIFPDILSAVITGSVQSPKRTEKTLEVDICRRITGSGCQK